MVTSRKKSGGLLGVVEVVLLLADDLIIFVTLPRQQHHIARPGIGKNVFDRMPPVRLNDRGSRTVSPAVISSMMPCAFSVRGLSLVM